MTDENRHRYMARKYAELKRHPERAEPEPVPVVREPRIYPFVPLKPRTYGPDVLERMAAFRDIKSLYD